MSVDPLSLTLAITAMIIGIVAHVRHSKCSNCEVDFKDDSPKVIYAMPEKDQKVTHKLESAIK